MCNNFTAVAFLLVIITTLDSFCFCTFIAKANEESGQENTREVVGSHTRTDEVAGVIFEKTQKRKLSLDDDSNNVPRFIVQKSDGTHKEFRLPEGASVIRDYCIDPQGKYMFITHQKANNLCPCTQIERGWCICGAISIIDLEKMEYVKSVLLDAVDRGAPGPWGILVDPDGKSLYIALSGSHELMVIDIQKMLQKITGYSEEKKGNIWHEIGFVDEFSRRISLPGNGPRKLEMIEGKLNVSMEFSDSSAILDFSAEEEPKIVEIRHDNKPKTPERLGEQYFNDATLSFQDWLSCASCHPDGGSDGLSWDLLVDGMGNPKKTRSLIGISKRSFYYSQATKNDLHKVIKDQFAKQLYTNQDDKIEAIFAYLNSLEPRNVPKIDRKTLQAGRFVFEKQGCAECHSGDGFTDNQMHDVGTKNAYDRKAEFLSSSLIDIRSNGPYLHDGRYETLEELFGIGKHGFGEESPNEEKIRELCEFLRSL